LPLGNIMYKHARAHNRGWQNYLVHLSRVLGEYPFSKGLIKQKPKKVRKEKTAIVPYFHMLEKKPKSPVIYIPVMTSLSHDEVLFLFPRNMVGSQSIKGLLSAGTLLLHIFFYYSRLFFPFARMTQVLYCFPKKQVGATDESSRFFLIWTVKKLKELTVYFWRSKLRFEAVDFGVWIQV